MMKNIQILLIMAALIGASFSMQASKIKVHPRHGTVVTKIYKPSVVVHNGSNIYYANGTWYKPYGRRYVVCRAPIGIRVKYLPKGYRVVRVNGKKYFRYNGIWYKKNGRFYTVYRVS